MIPSPPIWVLDIECYKNYFLVMCRNVYNGETKIVAEMFNGGHISNDLPEGTIVTFNGRNYDVPLLSYYRAGAPCEMLKAASDDIILNNVKPWELADKYGFSQLDLDHIDLIEVAPGDGGLKTYGARINSRKLQDLPIEPGAEITYPDIVLLRKYCANDLEVTCDLYRKLRPQIELREHMSAEYGIDLRSKSDAQILEAVIRKQIESLVGRRVYAPEIHPAYRFKYVPPAWVQFVAPGLQQASNLVRAAEFSIDHTGGVVMPMELDKLHIRIGKGLYRMGIGGLHSSETTITHYGRVLDRDVTSYYPSIILNERLYPSHLGEAFLSVYQSLVDRRIEAKRNGDTVTADALKICINGSFGKLGNRWSVLYSPDLLIQVTVTGQLALLMLIEALERVGCEVISANTDGVMFLPNDDRHLEAIKWWEAVTRFKTEETEYLSVHSKDVNNYIAVKRDGSCKLKGLYANAGLSKNTTNPICTKAAIEYLTKGVPIDFTIYGSTDIRDFLTVRKVSGGAVYDGAYLGKVVRWYYSTEGKTIHYKTNNNLVAKSKGAKPMMDLVDSIPPDLDYLWYITETKSILADLGVNYA